MTCYQTAITITADATASPVASSQRVTGGNRSSQRAGADRQLRGLSAGANHAKGKEAGQSAY